MLKAWGQEDTALSPEEASCWESRASGHLVSSAGLGLWPSGLFLSLPSALRGREWALQAVLSRVLGHWAAGQVSPRRACGKRLESGWGGRKHGISAPPLPWVPSLLAAVFVS